MQIFLRSEEEREEIRLARNTQSATSASAPSANEETEVVFPWHTDFKEEPTYLETVLGKEVSDISTEQEDTQRVTQNEEALFLSEVRKLAVKKI